MSSPIPSTSQRPKTVKVSFALTELGCGTNVAGTFPGRCREKAQDAYEYLTTAMTMYREMKMPYWLEQTEAALKG